MVFSVPDAALPLFFALCSPCNLPLLDRRCLPCFVFSRIWDRNRRLQTNGSDRKLLGLGCWNPAVNLTMDGLQPFLPASAETLWSLKRCHCHGGGFVCSWPPSWGRRKREWYKQQWILFGRLSIRPCCVGTCDLLFCSWLAPFGGL